MWQTYRRKGVIPMRPYEVGEDLSGIAVNVQDTPAAGGMIACNPEDQLDQWYVSPVYFAKYYVLL